VITDLTRAGVLAARGEAQGAGARRLGDRVRGAALVITDLTPTGVFAALGRG
jgi:hypothetical protein